MEKGLRFGKTKAEITRSCEGNFPPFCSRRVTADWGAWGESREGGEKSFQFVPISIFKLLSSIYHTRKTNEIPLHSAEINFSFFISTFCFFLPLVQGGSRGWMGNKQREKSSLNIFFASSSRPFVFPPSLFFSLSSQKSERKGNLLLAFHANLVPHLLREFYK